MLVYALIPARSGSKGLVNKNIIKINNHPLMAYAIAYGQKINVDRIIVSTDSKIYQNISLEYGAECPYLRSEIACIDTAREEDILLDLENNLPKYNIRLPDIWVWLKPTNPFRDVKKGIDGINMLINNKLIDSVRLVSESDLRLQQINSNGFLEIITEHWDPNYSKLPRTDFPKVYSPYNQEIFRHENWRRYGQKFMGDKIFPIICHKITGMDVDDLDTYEILKAMIESDNQPDIVKQHIHLF